MDKYGRSYSLKVQTDSGSILTIEPPFTIDFEIIRNTLTSANVCQLKIYNLSQKNRNQLRFNVSNYGEYRTIVFRAGYANKLPIVFIGNISQAFSYRQETNFITQIECYDGGFAYNNSQISIQFPAGSLQREVIRTMIGSLDNVSVGAVGGYEVILSRGNSYSGYTTQILAELTNGGFFIDNEKGYALTENQYIRDVGPQLLINSKSGLLGTPMLEETILRFDMLFEPSLSVGRSVKIDSLSDVYYNGEYKVTGFTHRGMISEAVCGSVTTTGEFLFLKNGEGVSI